LAFSSFLSPWAKRMPKSCLVIIPAPPGTLSPLWSSPEGRMKISEIYILAQFSEKNFFRKFHVGRKCLKKKPKRSKSRDSTAHRGRTHLKDPPTPHYSSSRGQSKKWVRPNSLSQIEARINGRGYQKKDNLRFEEAVKFMKIFKFVKNCWELKVKVKRRGNQRISVIIYTHLYIRILYIS